MYLFLFCWNDFVVLCFCKQIFYVIDTLYDISCRIQHIPSSHDIRKYSNIIKFYFENFGGLIMMGGDFDASSKCVAGIHIVDNDAYLLVVVSIPALYAGVNKNEKKRFGIFFHHFLEMFWRHTNPRIVALI